MNNILLKKNKLKEALLEWFESSTAHALPNIARSKYIFIQVFWIFCFIASAIYCFISIFSCIQSYLSNKTLTSMQIVYETPTDFPVVSFCNLKIIDKVKAKDYILNMFYQNGTKIANFQEFNNSDAYNYLYSLQNRILSGLRNNNSDLHIEYGFSLSDMLLSCTHNWAPCNLSDFKQFNDPYYGSCYSYNNNKNNIKKSNLGGCDYSFTLELFLGDPKIQTQYEFNDGIIIQIHNQSKLALFNNHKIIAGVGDETDFKINRNFIERLGPPYGDCLKDNSKISTFNSIYFDYIINSLNLSYSFEYCNSICLQDQIQILCNCSSVYFMNYKSKPTCTNNCDVAFVENILTKNNSIIKTCEKLCPFECDFVEYKVSTSKTLFPTDYYRNLLSNHPIINSSKIALDDIDKSVLRINVYYETMFYNYIKEEIAMTSDVFFSNIGGTLGLYLGISILSIFEIFELIIKLLIIFKKN